MINQQTAPFDLCPVTCHPLDHAITAMEQRARSPDGIWICNPWTSALRTLAEIDADPQGRLIIPPNEPIYTAEDDAPSEFHGRTGIFSETALDRQVGGGHYKDMAIQPAEFIERNKLSFLEGCVIKRMCRWRKKDGVQDLRKAMHEIELLIAMERLS